MPKGKQPYIPLYIGDWLQDTDCLSIEAEGAWLRLVFKCWKNNGTFTGTEDIFARLCKVSPEKFASILLELRLNDICDIHTGENGLLTIISRRIKREKEISTINAQNGSEGGSKKQANRVAKGIAKMKRIPDNDNDNEYDIKNKKELQQKITEAIFLDELFVEGLNSVHQGKNLRQAFNECYIHHSNAPNPPRELWEWRQKLNTWLTNTPVKKKKTATSSSGKLQ